jgi:hypothetical protein
MATGWWRPFEGPIEADGHKLVTLRDAGEYIAGFYRTIRSRRQPVIQPNI